MTYSTLFHLPYPIGISCTILFPDKDFANVQYKTFGRTNNVPLSASQFVSRILCSSTSPIVWLRLDRFIVFFYRFFSLFVFLYLNAWGKYVNAESLRNNIYTVCFGLTAAGGRGGRKWKRGRERESVRLGVAESSAGDVPLGAHRRPGRTSKVALAAVEKTNFRTYGDAIRVNA